MEKFIELDEVTVINQGYPILEKVSLTIPLGKTTFILGPSGSGKSTLIKVISGLIVPDSGTVRVYGKDFLDLDYREEKAFRQSAAFIFQDGALWANQTVYNNILIPLRHHFPHLELSKCDAMIKEALARVGFDDAVDVRPSTLSAGEQKLVAFARSTILDPQVLFMDEPTSFIDEQGERKISYILRNYAHRGKTMIAVGNLYQLAFRIADYLCIMNKNRLEQMGTILEVADNWPDFLVPIDDTLKYSLSLRKEGRGKKV